MSKEKKSDFTRIEICGGIASGKTTLAKLLSKNGFPIIYENFLNNPFWELFYMDPINNAFETEISFFLQHYNSIKLKLQEKHKLFACDFSVVMDLAYADINLKGPRHRIFNLVYKEALKDILTPSHIISLECDPDVEYDRILKRGRRHEKRATVSYLNQLNIAIKSRVKRLKGVEVLSLRSDEINFYRSQSGKASVLNTINAFLEES